MSRWTSTGELRPDERRWIGRFLADEPWYAFYFRCALSALAEGRDDRFYLIGRSRRGLVLGIAFAGIDVFTVVGEVDDDEACAVLDRGRPAEIHADPAQADAIAAASSRAWERAGIGYFQLRDAGPREVDPRCRRLTPADHAEVRALFAAHYPKTVLSPWMLEQPFVGLFEGGALRATAGVLVVEPEQAICHIGNFLTRPVDRGRGLGTAVGGALLEALREAGIRDVRLGVRADNPAARRVYARLGFTRLVERALLLDAR